MKSDTCFSKSGSSLSEYTTEAATQIICVESLKNACPCKDSHGNSKNLYTTRANAEKAQRISAATYDVSPSIYECPKGNGWHLTDN